MKARLAAFATCLPFALLTAAEARADSVESIRSSRADAEALVNADGYDTSCVRGGVEELESILDQATTVEDSRRQAELGRCSSLRCDAVQADLAMDLLQLEVRGTEALASIREQCRARPATSADAGAAPVVARSAAVPAPETPHPIWPMVWAGAGIAVAAATIATWVWCDGTSMKNNFEQDCAAPANFAAYEACNVRRTTLTSILDDRLTAVGISWGVAAAGAVVVGVGLYLRVGGAPPTPGAAPSASLWLAPQRMGITLRW